LLVWPMLATSRAARLPGLPRLAAAISCACALILVAHVAPRFVIGNGHSVNPWTTTLYPGAFPVAEAGALARTKRSYRVYNDMTWGGYLLYRLYPKARVISDGRVTFTAEVAELIRHERSEPLPVVAEVAAQRFGIDTVVVRRGRMQPTRSWQLVLRGPVAEVWLRNPAAAPVMPAP
ncbi:MAG TPA: hypothetical protein VHM19_12405, partial [Polyangiales bacterium]|nr:hypothetical protein [Polyangiales bacterium]